jgi:hypothetical protein
MSGGAGFFSYTHFDDQRMGGKLTAFRERLELEVEWATGQPFKIFQDVEGIALGARWQQRIDDALAASTFLIPFITPKWFRSAACRDEYEKFRDLEARAGSDSRIMPIVMTERRDLLGLVRSGDPIAADLDTRQYHLLDQSFRLRSLDDEATVRVLIEIAQKIKVVLQAIQDQRLTGESLAPESFSERLEKAANRLLSDQNEDGGWGARPHQVSSIVNTAEVLSVLHMAGIPATDDRIKSGVNFIATSARTHFGGEGGRRPFTRYLTYALEGLKVYPQLVERTSGAADAVEFCTSTLLANAIPLDGEAAAWDEILDGVSTEPSLFATALATESLSQSGIADKRLLDAGKWLAERDYANDGDLRFAFTALASLALGASIENRGDGIRLGTDLAQTHEQWVGRFDDDARVPATRWTHFTYSLALRACLRLRTISALSDPVRLTVEFVDGLWSETAAQWREGQKGALPSVRGTYHAVMAMQSVQLALARELDPLSILRLV